MGDVLQEARRLLPPALEALAELEDALRGIGDFTEAGVAFALAADLHDLVTRLDQLGVEAHAEIAARSLRGTRHAAVFADRLRLQGSDTMVGKAEALQRDMSRLHVAALSDTQPISVDPNRKE